MKRFFVLMFILVCFTGCSYFLDPMLYVRTPDISLSDLSEIRAYVRNNVSYKMDDEEYWQAPQETLDKGTGDCEDYCILVGYFTKQLGYDVYLVAIKKPAGFHMILELNGSYYEAQTVTPCRDISMYPKLSRISIDNALRICYNAYGSREVLDEN